MKRLFITRHAHAEAKRGPGPDIERPLSQRGKEEARRSAIRLQELDAIPDLLISSPAERARETARIMAAEWGWEESGIREDASFYPGDAEEILMRIAEFPSKADTVQVVGHQPVMGHLVDLLTGHAPGEVPTATVFRCAFEVNDWRAVVRGSGVLEGG